MARELRAAGVNLDFAPMLDLATNPASPVTSGRSFGADPQEVARMGVAFLRGLAAEGILACAKHFPGHGDAAVDPHIDLPRFDGTPERLTQQELVPFAAAIAAGVPLVMTAHILLPQLDPDRPASISPLVLDGLLRRQLHFDGVILADDLGMGAIARRYGPGESVVKTLEAGTDIAMLCHDSAAVPRAIEAVARSLEEGRFEPAQWSAGRARIARLREQLAAASQPLPPLDVVGCAEHRALAEEIRARLAHARIELRVEKWRKCVNHGDTKRLLPRNQVAREHAPRPACRGCPALANASIATESSIPWSSTSAARASGKRPLGAAETRAALEADSRIRRTSSYASEVCPPPMRAAREMPHAPDPMGGELMRT